MENRIITAGQLAAFRARLREEERIVMAQAREGSVASIERDEVQKVLCLCNPERTDEVERRLRERFPGLVIAKSSDTLIEVMRAGSTKAQAVRTLCDLWGMDPADAIAFGDNYNDVPMLELAGTAYLMEGAAAELKARFPRHCAQVVPELARLADALPPRI